jgi:hypothetical protein
MAAFSSCSWKHMDALVLLMHAQQQNSMLMQCAATVQAGCGISSSSSSGSSGSSRSSGSSSRWQGCCYVCSRRLQLVHTPCKGCHLWIH